VSQDGSATLRTTTRFCYDAACAISATGLTLLRQIDNYVDGTAGGAGGNATDVSTDYLYDPSANGQLTRESRRNYDAAGALLDARAIGYVYDANGNQTAEIANYVDGDTLDPDDATPNPTTLARTDLSTAYGYDTAGNLVSVADPRRAIEAPAGADDYVSRTAYDALNRRVRETTPTTPGLQITCPVGNPTCREATWGYDELGGLMVATDYGKVDTGARYDRVGRAIETIEMTRGLISAKSTGLTGYDAAGRVVWTKNRQQVGDATLGRTETNYDELGRPIDVTEAAASSPDVATTTRTTYDALDRVTSVETGVGTGTGQTTATAYDLGGRTVQTNDEFGCATSTFDYRGLGLTKTEGKTPAATCTGTGSRTLTNTYDGLGRLTRTEITASITAGEIGTRTTDVVLDAAGNTRSSAVGGGTTFTVNRLDQTVAEIRPAGATAKTTFDAAGNQVDRCFWSTSTAEVCQAADYGGYADAPDTASTTTYDARNQRVGLKTPDAGETTYDPGHDYAPAANYLEIGSNVEAQTLYDYDDRHRLTSITHQSCAVTPGTHTCTGSVTSLGSDAYEYDDDSRTRVVESNGATSFDRHYCYDALDQLTSVRSSAGCASGLLESYAYDDASNRTSKTVSGATTTYAHDAEGQLTSCSPSCGTISYDAAGRTATWNGWYLAYDGEGRLASACKASGCPGTADQVTMTYDGEGHRTSLTVKPANQAATTTTFRYQGDAVVEESVGGTVTRRYVVDEGGTIVKLVIPAGQANSGEYLVTWNGHGDATGLWRVDAGGALTLANSYAYDTWGRPTTAPHNSVPDLGFRFLYVGRFDVQWDRALGLDLTYMHARHYSPALGRFLQPDPAASETHFYRYGGNSPIVNIDPDGKLFWVIAVAVVRVAVWVGPRVATLTRVIKFSVPKVARSGSVVPKWVKNAGTAANWAKNLGNAFKSNGTIPTVRTIRALIEVARKYKLPIECHTGRYHPPPWNIPHLHIGKPARFHVPLPPGWTPPGIVCT
jgi:RHS repeat-associated protein